MLSSLLRLLSAKDAAYGLAAGTAAVTFLLLAKLFGWLAMKVWKLS